MPPLPNVPNGLRVDLDWSAGLDTTALTRLHFIYSGSAPATADCAAFALDFTNSFTAHLASLCSGNNNLEQVVVTDIASNTGAQGQHAGPFVGTRAGSNLTGATAVLMNHQIARRYRGGKPRSYLPFFVSADLVGAGGWQSTAVAAMNTGWAAFIAAVIPATSGSTTIEALANVSYYQGYNAATITPSGRAKNHPKLRGAPLVDLITGSTCNNKPASQRRRNQH
jgi:hypothetical protein